MMRLLWGFALLASASGLAAEPEPTTVMVLGTFHMANPGRDLHNQKVDDMLEAPRQRELAAVAEALAKFHPTRIAVEWPAEVTRERYAQFLAGTLPPAPNEVVQVGFRLARLAGLTEVHGIDVKGDFPYEAVQKYAKAHGQEELLARLAGEAEKQIKDQSLALAQQGVSGELRLLNAPDRIAHSNEFYRSVLRVGSGSDQPGADLLTAWYGRNFQICARLVQLSSPGDRVVVLYGAGHAFLLRQCVLEMPGFRLIEPNDYLP